MSNQPGNPSHRVRHLRLQAGQRAFVVGDIHGAFRLVDEALALVDFRPEHDLLLSVGDLIDRGAESAAVLEFLQRPYVHAVIGNHEDILLRAHAEEQPDRRLLALMLQNYGAEWWLRTVPYVQQRILEVLRTLPTVIELTTPTGRVGIVHADIPTGMSWQIFAMAIERSHPRTLAIALESRSRLRQGLVDRVPGIDRVYVGHTIQQRARALGNIGCIDTGAIFRTQGLHSNYHLTLVDALAPLACLDAEPLIDNGRIRVYGAPLERRLAMPGYPAQAPAGPWQPAPGRSGLPPDGIPVLTSPLTAWPE